ncbi:MAG: efflux RND transporter periplasmic adaptor subunit, partial [Longimicrobiales bacterium]
VEADRGEAVTAGTLLASIDDGSAEQAYASARSAVNSAQTSLDVAQRQAERTEALVEGGALAERDLDLALAAVAQTRSQLDAAQAQFATAAERLENTSVRAPITGVVAARAVSIGDVVSPGAALFTVIDPSSMRLEAEVPSAALGELSVGTPVQFAVRGYPNQLFEGEVVAISPAADPVTRQIPITVSIPNPGNRLVAGLFAEGRIGTESAEGLVAPTSAVDLDAAAPTVLRLTGGRAEEVAVDIGIIDTETERVQFISGVEAGDTLLIGAARAITPGTPVRVESIGEAAPSGV